VQLAERHGLEDEEVERAGEQVCGVVHRLLLFRLGEEYGALS
jgi:hypothetical protein